MTPRLERPVSREVRRVPRDSGLEVATTRGSHATLFRVTASGEQRVFTAPVHAQLPTGTLRAIYRQASRFVAGAELGPRLTAWARG